MTSVENELQGLHISAKGASESATILPDDEITPSTVKQPPTRPCAPVQKAKEVQVHVSSDEDDDSDDYGYLIDDKECTICCEEMAGCDFPQLPQSCTHESDACASCVSKYMCGEIDGTNNSAHTTVKCMSCPTQLTVLEVQPLVPAKIFEIFEYNTTRETFRSDPEFFQCPSPDCQGWQLNQGGNNLPIVNCRVCKGQYCFKHKVPWHSSVSCDEYDELTPEHQVQISNIKNIKHCPACNILVEKVDGCDAVTCKGSARAKNIGCGFKFCWQCDAPYNGKNGILAKDNSVHQQHCIHFPANSGDDGHIVN